MSLPSNYKCNICNKYYKSKQSFWNHKNKFHSKNNPDIIHHNHSDNHDIIKYNHITDIKNEDSDKKYSCKFCHKNFTHYQNRWRHEKKCKESLLIKNEMLEKQNQELKEMFKKEISLLKQQLLESMNKNCKKHPKTLQKINKFATANKLNNQYNNNQTNTNCIVNNNTINIIPLGQEKLTDILSSKEQKMILSKKQQSLNYLIEYIHFNDKYPQFQNIIITNLKDNIAYKYDDSMNKFIATTKDELLEILMENRIIDIEDFYSFNSDKLNENTKITLNKFIDKIRHDDEYFDKKNSDIKLILYNNSDIKKLN